MANLKVNNYHIVKLRINKDEYWDFFLNRDSYGNGYVDVDACTISNLGLGECEDGWVLGDA